MQKPHLGREGGREVTPPLEGPGTPSKALGPAGAEGQAASGAGGEGEAQEVQVQVAPKVAAGPVGGQSRPGTDGKLDGIGKNVFLFAMLWQPIKDTFPSEHQTLSGQSLFLSSFQAPTVLDSLDLIRRPKLIRWNPLDATILMHWC